MRKEIVVRQEGPRVLLGHGGRLVADLPWNAALDLGRALIQQARRAEEIAKAESIAYDQAILIRGGFPLPLGLTDHPDIQAEAAKAAAWDSSLRRFMPGGVRSQEQFGTPTVTQCPPPKGGKP